LFSLDGEAMTAKEWSVSVAGLAVDALLDHGLIKKADFERAAEIAAEEIHIRLTMGDYPPAEQLPSE
jgi:hypothetical protein